MELLSNKNEGETLRVGEWSQAAKEIESVITVNGQALSSGDLDQLGQSISEYVAVSSFYTSSSGPVNYIATPIGSFQAPQAYSIGMTVRIRPNQDNTGAATIDVNGLGQKDIKTEIGGALVAEDLVTTRDAVMRYDGTDFLLANYALLPPGGTILPRGSMYGLEYRRVSDTSLQIRRGACVDQANANTIDHNVATTTKLIDTAWAAGDGNGGMPAGELPLTANTFYFIFVILNTTTGAVDMGYDAATPADEAAEPTALLAASGFDSFRRVGSFMTHATSGVRDFKPIGDEIQFIDPPPEDQDGDPGTGGTLVQMSVPPIHCMCRFRLSYEGNGSKTFFWLTTRDPGRPASIDDHTFMWEDEDTPDRHSVMFELMTDDAGKIFMERAAGAVVEFKVQVIGWRDNRRRSQTGNTVPY